MTINKKSVPGRSLLNRFAGAVVLGDQTAREDFAIHTGGEARLVLADHLLGGRRRGGELFRIEVPTARDAVNVRVLVGRARCGFFAFAFGDALFSLHCGGTKPKVDAWGQARSALSSASN